VLAVSPLCGTNLAVAGVLAGLASTVSAGNRSRWERLPGVLLASMLAVLAAQPVGRWLQKYVTTSPDLATRNRSYASEHSAGTVKVKTAADKQRPGSEERAAASKRVGVESSGTPVKRACHPSHLSAAR
jgi:hypothetical protein